MPATLPSYVRTLKRAHERLIEENPEEITITRVERVREEGGFREVESTYSLRGRVYQEATGRSGDHEVITTAGQKNVDARWGLITYTTMRTASGKEIPLELKADSKTGDVFESRHGSFRVLVVYPREDAGTIWGWQAALERVH